MARRREAWARLGRRRRRAVMLVEELGLDGTTSTSDIRKMLDQMHSLDMVELLLELEPFLQRHISDDDLAVGPPDTFA